jgi:hypothetical protein
MHTSVELGRARAYMGIHGRARTYIVTHNISVVDEF